MERGSDDRQAPEDQPTTAVPAQKPPTPQRPSPPQRPGPPQRPSPPQRPGPPQRPQGQARQRQRGSGGGPRRRFGVEQARNPGFTMVFRGYEREAVDRYVAQVIELITELEATQTREGTVQRALEEVGEQTSSILQKAHETAEEISSHSRAQAEGRLARSEREAEQTVSEAEAEAQRIRTDARGVWQQRTRLIEELRRLSDEVLTVADDALERLDPPEPQAPPEPQPPAVLAEDPDEAEPAPPPPPPDASGERDSGDDDEQPERTTIGPIGDPLDLPPQGADPTADEQPAVRRVGPERRQG